jgi:hypothetical protein
MEDFMDVLLVIVRYSARWEVIGVKVGKIFVLVYFIFHGIRIILGGIYLLVKKIGGVNPSISLLQ